MDLLHDNQIMDHEYDQVFDDEKEILLMEQMHELHEEDQIWLIEKTE